MFETEECIRIGADGLQNYIDPLAIGFSQIIVACPTGSQYNAIRGNAQLRGIWGGYDNRIGASIASNIFGSHHTAIDALDFACTADFHGASTLNGTPPTSFPQDAPPQGLVLTTKPQNGQTLDVKYPGAFQAYVYKDGVWQQLGPPMSHSSGHNVVVGGSGHRALSHSGYSTVIAGQQCSVGGSTSSVLASDYSNCNAAWSTIVGGRSNNIGFDTSSGYAVVAESLGSSLRKGDIIKVENTSAIGSVGDQMAVFADRRSWPASRAPFSVEVISKTELAITSECPSGWFAVPALTQGVKIYRSKMPGSNVKHAAIVCGDSCTVETQDGSYHNAIINSKQSTATPGVSGFCVSSRNCFSTIIGGLDSTVNQSFQYVVGHSARPLLPGQHVRSYGCFKTPGDRQVSTYIMGLRTTGNTPQEWNLLCQGHDISQPVPTQTAFVPGRGLYLLTASIIAAEEVISNKSAMFDVECLFSVDENGRCDCKRKSVVTKVRDNTTWSLDFALNTKGGKGSWCLLVNSTGSAVRWMADVKILELGL